MSGENVTSCGVTRTQAFHWRIHSCIALLQPKTLYNSESDAPAQKAQQILSDIFSFPFRENLRLYAMDFKHTTPPQFFSNSPQVLQSWSPLNFMSSFHEALSPIAVGPMCRAVRPFIVSLTVTTCQGVTALGNLLNLLSQEWGFPHPSVKMSLARVKVYIHSPLSFPSP